MTGEREGIKFVCLLFFFCSRFNFRAITRLETLATQAKNMTKPKTGDSYFILLYHILFVCLFCFIFVLFFFTSKWSADIVIPNFVHSLNRFLKCFFYLLP